MANIAITTYCNLHCPYCVPAGTQVLMANGETKNIEDIKVGDIVLGFNEESEPYKQRRINPTVVTNVMSRESDHIYNITMSDGKQISITGEHPVLNGEGAWTEVKNLKEKVSEIKSIGYTSTYTNKDNGSNEYYFYNNVINSIVKVDAPITVYNIETESHTYVANGLAVHNCFANDMIEEQHNNIDLEQFRMILRWLARTPKNHIGLIGGEPTLHPHFDEIINEVNHYIRENNTDCTLFTNGICLDEHIANMSEGIHLLINVNAPEGMKAEQWTKLNSTLDHLSVLGWFLPGRARANIGCNLYMERTDYSYFWEIVDRYRIDHVRTSVTAPMDPKYRKNKEKYYTDMKPIFMRFLEDAERRGVSLGADCNQIPDCYFTKEELERIYRIMPDRHSCICTPVVDITPEFTATACFGCYDPVDCSDFDTLIQLEDYLLHKKTYPRVQANCTGKCVGCKKNELLICEGGCLGFADEELLKKYARC